MRRRLRFAYVLVGLLACAWCVGCSGGGVKEGAVLIVSGKITDGGKTLEVKSGGRNEIVFSPVPEKEGETPLNKRSVGKVDADGNFKMTGDLGRGIVLGKYRIAVLQWEPTTVKPGTKDAKGEIIVGGMRDALHGKFSEKNSPILRTITAKDSTVNIDISQPEG